MRKITICITDDHKIVADGISSYLIGDEKYELRNYSRTGQELLDKLKTRQPDILLLDINLPGISGLHLAKIVNKEYPAVKIVMLTSSTDEKSLDESLKAGAVGYLSKDITEEEFLTALDKIMEGENYFSTGIRQTVFNVFTEKVKNEERHFDDALSEREIEVIKLIAEGLSLREIGERLFISARTVETHKKNILEKLDLHSTVDLVKYAILNGYITL